MFRLSTDKYTLIGISVIAIIILVIATYIFVAYIIHDKRKFNSIDKYNTFAMDKPKTYNENKKDYNTNVKMSGVNHDSKAKLKIIKKIIEIFKRGSKWPLLFGALNLEFQDND